MKRLPLLLFLSAVGCFAQCTIQTINATDPVSTGPAKLNANFTSLNTCKTNRYSGSSVPGLISSSRLGDLYTRTGTTQAYMCFAAGPCTAVASGNWVLLPTGSATGTVTVVGSGNLTSTALVTGGGTQTLQTAAVTATMDASGNISTPGTLSVGAGSSAAGSVFTNRTTVSGLPTCDSNAEGTRMSVNDATATTFFSVVAGGGSNHVPVYCDGSNWRIG